MFIRKQRNELTLDEKLDLLNKSDSCAKLTTLSVENNVDKSVISRIKSKGSELRKLCFENKNMKKKRQRKTGNTKTEKAIVKVQTGEKPKRSSLWYSFIGKSMSIGNLTRRNGKFEGLLD